MKGMINAPFCQVDILVVDASEIVRWGVKAMLQARVGPQSLKWAEAGNGPEGLDKAMKHDFDIVLVDAQLPGMSGYVFVEELLKVCPDVRALAMSNFPELSSVQRMIDIGTAGFILKDIPAVELVQAIEAVQIGKRYFSSRIANLLVESGMDDSVQSTGVANLSRRELEILRLIVLEKKNKEIAEELFLGIRTVETHRKNLMLKLQVRNSAGLVRAGYERGLLA